MKKTVKVFIVIGICCVIGSSLLKFFLHSSLSRIPSNDIIVMGYKIPSIVKVVQDLECLEINKNNKHAYYLFAGDSKLYEANAILYSKYIEEQVGGFEIETTPGHIQMKKEVNNGLRLFVDIEYDENYLTVEADVV